MHKFLKWLVAVAIISLAIAAGMLLERMRNPGTAVHAQDSMMVGSSTCVATVPTEWGEFKGGSSYGLAFQDSQGRLRFVLNPPCGGSISNQEPPSAYVALEIQRK